MMNRLFPVVVILLGFSLSGCGPDSEEGKNLSRTPKEECEDLMNALVPFARQQLAEHGEFFPFGGTMSPEGEVAYSAAYDGREQPPSQDLIDMMTARFREQAAKREIKACAIVADVRVIPPGAGEKMDAIRVQLDHEDDYSVVVFLPYRLSEAGKVVFGDIFAQNGADVIFRP